MSVASGSHSLHIPEGHRRPLWSTVRQSTPAGGRVHRLSHERKGNWDFALLFVKLISFLANILNFIDTSNSLRFGEIQFTEFVLYIEKCIVCIH